MNALAIKVEMFEMLSHTHDDALLLKLYKTMKEVFESSQIDWYDEHKQLASVVQIQEELQKKKN
jgi:hypothetical protein